MPIPSKLKSMARSKSGSLSRCSDRDGLLGEMSCSCACAGTGCVVEPEVADEAEEMLCSGLDS